MILSVCNNERGIFFNKVKAHLLFRGRILTYSLQDQNRLYVLLTTSPEQIFNFIRGIHWINSRDDSS